MYLSHPADVSPLVLAYQKSRELCRQMPSFIADGIAAQLPENVTGERRESLEDDRLL